MEGICGKRGLVIDRAALLSRLGEFREVAIDLGTGDGRYVRQIAHTTPGQFAIGIDTCRENLRELSRCAPDNALYLIADALALPDELAGLATRITINFPWGSLLRGLLTGTPIGNNRLLAIAWCVVIALGGYLWSRTLYERSSAR